MSDKKDYKKNDPKQWPEQPLAKDELPEEKNKKAGDIFGSLKSFLKKKRKAGHLDLLETNLIKDEIEIKFDYRKDLKAFALLFLLVFIIIAESYLFLNNWKDKKEKENSLYLGTEIARVKSDSATLEQSYQQALLFQKKLNLASNSLKEHVYWTNFFDFLEKNTLRKNMYYLNFSGDIYGQYLLPGLSNDVLALSFQTKTFSSQPLVNSASVSDEEIISREGSEQNLISFNLNFALNPNIFTN